MPPDIAAWVASFVQRYHVERAAYRRRRDRSDRGPGQHQEIDADE